jgi:hypothetical protein
VTNADGSVCKQCVDASGMIVQQDCSPPPPPGGSGGSSGSTGGGTCTKIQDGGPTSCKDTATWMKYGATACAQQNLMLTDIAWDVACPGYDGHYQSVTYVCCGG